MKHAYFVGKHLPHHFTELYPKFVESIQKYYEYLESGEGIVDQVSRKRILNGETSLIRTDTELFNITGDSRLSGIDSDDQDISIADWRAPEWWLNNLIDILNMERIQERLVTSLDEEIVTTDNDVLNASYVYKQPINDWYVDSGFSEAALFNGDPILTARLLRSLYQLKGTTAALKMFFSLFFGEEITLINPNELIAIIDDNFILDSSVTIGDDEGYSAFGIIINTSKDRSYYEPLFTDVYLKVFHPAGFGVIFNKVESAPDIPNYIIPELTISLINPYKENISSTGKIKIDGLNGGNRWEYSLNGGNSFTRGYGTSFTLPEGEYDTGTIVLRQYTGFGEYSKESSNTSIINVITTPPKLEATLTSDFKRIVGSTESRLQIEILDSDYNLLKTFKSDNDGRFRWFKKDGIQNGLYYIRVRGLSGLITDLKLNVSYIDTTLPIPEIIIESLSANGIVTVNDIENNDWEYSVDGGFSWNDGSQSSHKIYLKDGYYKRGSIIARCIKGKNKGHIGINLSDVNVILLRPKLTVIYESPKIIIIPSRTGVLEIYRNSMFIKSVQVSDRYEYEETRSGEYEFKLTDALNQSVSSTLLLNN